MALPKNRCHPTHLAVLCVASILAPAFATHAQLLAGDADLDQIRNGSASNPTNPADWVNGNAGQSNAHYVEGYSVAYRCVMQQMSLGQHQLDIEWDIKHSSKHALDYITNFNRIHPHSVFTHAGGCGPGCAEIIDPTIGIGGTLVGPITFPIPAPSSAGSPVVGQPTADFNSLPLIERSMSIWNGTITNIQYLAQGSLAGGSASSSVRITFTANAPNVIIAWGGHIAKATVWGAGNSAAQISGSPYHTRLLALDGSGGNQDRSLSANAVIFPPDCDIDGPTAVCPGSTTQFCGPSGNGLTYQWSVQSDCGAQIIGSATSQCVNVKSCNSCGSFTLNLNVINSGGNTQCSTVINVQDLDDPIFINCPANQNIQCGSAIPPCSVVTANDACSGPITANCTTGPLVPNNCGGTVTRTYTATDSCGNTATCTQVFTVVDTTPPVINGAPGSTVVQCIGQIPPCPVLTATDVCDGTIPVNCTTSTHIPGGCGGRIVRVFTATDSCGNTTTHPQAFTINDTTLPNFSAPGDQSVQCPGDVPPCPVITATDNCAGNIPVNCTTGPLVGGPCGGSITRTFTASDPCGNTRTRTQVFTVNDTTDPVILSCPEAIEVDCARGVPPCDVTSILVSDNCTPVNQLTVDCVTVPVGGGVAGEGESCGGSLLRIYTVTDACNNSATCQQIINVPDDEIAPIFVDPPDTIDACLGEPLFLVTPEVEDNCDPAPQVVCTRSDGLPCDDPFFPPGLTSVTYTVIDFCGNSTSVSFDIVPNCCDTEFQTYTQAHWGGANFLNRIKSMLSAPHGALIVGKTNSNPVALSVKIAKAAAQAIVDRLPAAGSAAKLPAGLGNANVSAVTLNTNPPLPVNPDGTFTNLLLGNTMALELNLRNDQENDDGTLGYVALSEQMTTQKANGDTTTYVIPANVIQALLDHDMGVSINDLLELANMALAGRNTAPATVGQINTAVSRINTMFVGGRTLIDCNCAPATAATTAAAMFDPAAILNTTAPAPVKVLGDINASGAVDRTDLTALLADWGKDDSPADIDADGHVDSNDLMILLGNWGATAQ